MNKINANTVKSQVLTCRLFQIACEGDFQSLCTVTFWQKIDFLNSNLELVTKRYIKTTVLYLLIDAFCILMQLS